MPGIPDHLAGERVLASPEALPEWGVFHGCLSEEVGSDAPAVGLVGHRAWRGLAVWTLGWQWARSRK